jgi:hypothetical protein
MADDVYVEDTNQVIVSRLPAFPNYPAPLPPSLEDAPVYVGSEPTLDSDDEESMTDTGEYEIVVHEPLTEKQAMDSLRDMVRETNFHSLAISFCYPFSHPNPFLLPQKSVIGKEGRAIYAYESKLPPAPTPLLPPDEDVDAGYDPFRSSLPESISAPLPPQEEAQSIDLSHITDWTPLSLLQAYFRAQLTRGWFARRSTTILIHCQIHFSLISSLSIFFKWFTDLNVDWQNQRDDDLPQRFSCSRNSVHRANLRPKS